jgi:hypothetical protein
MGIGHEVDRVRVEVVTAVSDIRRVSRAATRLETILLRSVWSRIDRFLAAILLFRTFADDESHGNSASRMNLRDPNDILGFGGGDGQGRTGQATSDTALRMACSNASGGWAPVIR